MIFSVRTMADMIELGLVKVDPDILFRDPVQLAYDTDRSPVFRDACWRDDHGSLIFSRFFVVPILFPHGHRENRWPGFTGSRIPLLNPMISPDNDVTCMVSSLVFCSIRYVEHRAGTDLLDHFTEIGMRILQ